MIAHLKGKILSKLPNQLILDVAGVGYDLTIPLSTFYEMGENGDTVSLFVLTHVREDVIALYGFRTREEKSIFEKLLSVSGVGPKLGIAILSGISTEELVASIQQGDVARLTHIPGIGRKTAERLILELRDKLKDWTGAIQPTPAEAAHPTGQLQGDAVSALLNLGYPQVLADKAVREVLRTEASPPTFEILLKKSLQFLTR
ncbi:MAG: Holliday junction branch migration protein RuvA [Acidobacteriia bacterium]|nr:Holliday junction branch migration protein RuvA [Terriglobia bacterium]